MNKKGFTLVELLAIIIILGILAVMVTPVVSNVVKNGKIESLAVETLDINKSIEDDCNIGLANGEKKDNYILNENKIGDVELKGDIPDTVNVTKYSNKCNFEVAVKKNGYCAIKNYDSKTATGGILDGDNCVTANGDTIGTFAEKTKGSCFEFDSNTGTITKFKCYKNNTYGLEEVNDLVIPSYIDGVAVKKIGPNAFAGGELFQSFNSTDLEGDSNLVKSYEIPYTKDFDSSKYTSRNIENAPKNIDNLLKCYKYNMYKDYILDFVKSEVIKYDPSTFNISDYTSCNIEHSIPYFDDPTMYYTFNTITFPNTLEVIEEDAFRGVKVDEITFPTSLERIKNNAFQYSSVSVVNLNDNLEYIDDWAFSNTNILKLKVPNSVKYIGNNSFKFSKLSQLDIDLSKTKIEGNSFIGNNFSSDKLYLYETDSSGNVNYKKIIAYMGKQSSITVPSTVTDIGDKVFQLSYITSITLPSNLKTIGKYAFDGAFIKNITFPSTLEDIGDYAFKNNPIQTVNLSNTKLTKINKGVFYYTAVNNVSFPSSLTEIGKYAFKLSYISNIVIPGTVKKIGPEAFYYNEITNITLNEGLEEIGASAFARNGFTQITIPSTVKTTDYYFLHKDNYLTKITNKTGNTYDFSKILNKGNSSTCTFNTGTCSGVTVVGG